MHKKVAIIMGSSSDAAIMGQAAAVLQDLGIPYEMRVVSAHRNPEGMFDYAKTLEERDIAVVIAGAGGAAHLPGMVAALSCVPVIGVPVKSSNSIDGWDSLLSIVQMPNDIPVATVAVNGAHNAGVLAATILAVSDPVLMTKMKARKQKNREKTEEQNRTLNNN